MLGAILGSYAGSGLILGYLELADMMFSYVDKITEKQDKEILKDMEKISNTLKQVEKRIKENKKWLNSEL